MTVRTLIELAVLFILILVILIAFGVMPNHF